MAVVVSAGSRHEVFRDAVLLILLRTLAESVRRDPSCSDLRGDAEAWERAIADNAPGVVSFELGPVVDEPSRRDVFVRLLSEIEPRLHAYGGQIPVTELRRRFAMPGIRWLAPLDVELVLEGLHRLQELAGGD
jgi:hypothetical protein